MKTRYGVFQGFARHAAVAAVALATGTLFAEHEKAIAAIGRA